MLEPISAHWQVQTQGRRGSYPGYGRGVRSYLLSYHPRRQLLHHRQNIQTAQVSDIYKFLHVAFYKPDGLGIAPVQSLYI